MNIVYAAPHNSLSVAIIQLKQHIYQETPRKSHFSACQSPLMFNEIAELI